MNETVVCKVLLSYVFVALWIFLSFTVIVHADPDIPHAHPSPTLTAPSTATEVDPSI